MAIYRMLEGRAFDAETVTVITRAYEDARAILGLKQRGPRTGTQLLCETAR